MWLLTYLIKITSVYHPIASGNSSLLFFAMGLHRVILNFPLIFTISFVGNTCAESCTANNFLPSEIFFTGNKHDLCSFDATLRTSTGVLEVPSINAPYFLYMERNEIDYCSNTYVTIDGQGNSCHVMFNTENRFQLNLQGNITVHLKEIHSIDFAIPVS